MIRGIGFEGPNAWYPIFDLILKNIDLKKYFWFLADEDVIDCFDKDRYLGEDFEKVIKTDEYYAISINLQAYLNEKDITVPLKSYSYKEFLKSKCELIIYIDDNVYIYVYAKDEAIINVIKENAENSRFGNIRYMTDESDDWMLD